MNGVQFHFGKKRLFYLVMRFLHRRFDKIVIDITLQWPEVRAERTDCPKAAEL